MLDTAIVPRPCRFPQAKPLEEDILTLHYVIEGPPDSPYAGGHYHGVLKFPPEYPMKPPSVLMLTPNGRFSVNTRICLSMSDFHPETWNPVWSYDKILVGLQSFMVENASTAGSVTTNDDLKRKYAAESLAANCANKEFARLFPELVALEAQQRAARAAAAGSGGAETSGAAASGGAGGAVAGAAGGLSIVQTLCVVVGFIAALVALSFIAERFETPSSSAKDF